ncbi:HAD-IC family P-type ATPase [Furfurilactobacillus rossiae]|uniref:Cation transport ATPase n=1 Tax=Furfurilactobacillus rossiae DSM 15814 TaxID=1114972 RepID=A0A0R1RCH2_9LACO|nr:HAD-IC family P-type ATPase [Furfurilactobacillus rossiae]KRL54567.1 cation transport ATPase [Furfurilactobacillus rossiae DSM 15814]QFR67324.1 HAD-IC family P-type ATPase [Furfurilactobacillus rossiae]QLE60258.1 Cation transport ATPase [Furfurilactobacillus rossiae]
MSQNPNTAPDAPDPKPSPVYVQTETEVLDHFHSDLETGLTAATAADRLAKNGPNELTAHVTPKWLIFLRQFNNVIIYILLFAAAFTLFIRHYSDAVVIGLVVIINALIGYFQEVNASNALDKIKSMLSTEATVIRDSARTDVPATELVTGDIVYLEAGDNVPADMRILDSDNLRIQESALTGEPDSVLKNFDPLKDSKTPLAERENMAYASTAVTNGSATGIVTATGHDTELGQIADDVTDVKQTKTPLMKELDRLGTWISYFIIAVAIALFIFGWARHLYALPTLALAIITMIVGSLPEGLPASTSVILAMGVNTMARNKAIVKTLPSVETLGAVDIIATDKTGTLTKNEMTAQDIITKDHQYQVTGTGYQPKGQIVANGQPVNVQDDPVLKELLISGFEANDTMLQEEDGQWILNGEPTDGAFLTLYHKGCGMDEPAFEELDRIPFDSDYRYIARLSVREDGQHEVFVKGAPDKLYEMAQAADPTFNVDHWNDVIHDLTTQGKRVVAVGRKLVGKDISEVTHETLRDGVDFLGIVGIIDPPREEVIDALKEMRTAGVKVKMITGDHPDTATAIGRQLGLADNIQTITGAELDDMSPDELRANINRYDVFARTTPSNKLAIIKAYQENGKITAMTGDGVNDAPALKRADIGVAMGIKGTDVAKDAADMILVDDNFTTMTKAIREGRRLYDNIKKTIAFLLPTSFAEGLIVAFSILMQQKLPLVPTQLLWINMVSAVTIQFAFIFEPAEQGIMQRRPRKTGSTLMNKHDVFQMAYVSVLIAAMGLWAFDWLTNNGVSQVIASTITVNVIVLGKVFYLFNIRSPHLAFSKNFWTNKMAFVVIAALMLLQLAQAYIPFMQDIFKTGPMSWSQWGLAIVAGFVTLVVTEADKIIRMQWHKRKQPRMN